MIIITEIVEQLCGTKFIPIYMQNALVCSRKCLILNCKYHSTQGGRKLLLQKSTRISNWSNFFFSVVFSIFFRQFMKIK